MYDCPEEGCDGQMKPDARDPGRWVCSECGYTYFDDADIIYESED